MSPANPGVGSTDLGVAALDCRGKIQHHGRRLTPLRWLGILDDAGQVLADGAVIGVAG